MIAKFSVVTILAFASSMVACGGSKPEAQEPEHVVAEERAEKAADTTEANTDRAEDAADKAEGNAADSAKSADKAEKAADDTKK